MNGHVAAASRRDLAQNVDPSSYARAMLNILSDFADERERLLDAQRAMQNILDDFGAEKAHLEDAQRAVLNVLEDLDVEKTTVDRVNVSLGIEIAERRRAEAALEARTRELARSNAELESSNSDLVQFAYVASHDLSAPLRTISGFADLLQERYRGRLDPEADEFLGFITGGVTHLQQLIDDLLAYSRVDTRAAPPASVDTTALAEEVAVGIARSIGDVAATVTIETLPTVVADGVQLGQVLQNLMANALKFVAHDVRPVVRVSAEREPGAWRFVVADNGVGVEERHREQIFGMFERLHPNDVYPGTGIGLAICRKIVERHGGRIWVEDNPGGGSRFCFTVPDPVPAD